ncbi:caspase family protein [Nodosilinea sp. E11]|uniref:caspase family protein n=1 Tax=Nodosilinea sp. E11 TaxID=3037479 RepID=UPI0029350AE0|nr:caspase family protein [Nodosilinea sp. E11]WOD40787.1 caspase family protein [Nodosilinea sp. E11]
MRLNRRAFLQQASLALGALGVGGTALLAGSNQYQQALAKPARRKLALLIGINAYPDRALDPGVAQDVALRGCLTDIDLQRQLLVHRFGFQPVDVVTLTNQEATRAGILTAIDEHLVQQAQADDVVVLHFSGYGSQVQVQGAAENSSLHLAWVTADSHLPSEDSPALADLLEAEVVARLAHLATPNLTTVIDAGSQDAGYLRWGNSRVRSRPTVPTGTFAALGDPSLPLGDPLTLPWPGLLLRAADTGRLVLESQWEGFSAGVFTYALTQSLWAGPPTPSTQALIQRAERYLQRWVGADQRPVVSDRLPARSGPGVYGLQPQSAGAEGVVLSSGSDRPLTLWLGGVPPQVLRYLQPGSQLEVTSPTGQTIPLRLESRLGLKSTAKPLASANLTLATLARQPVYERVRVLPQTIDLVVALDSQLKRVERVDATSALAGLPLVTAVTAGEKAADCLFGRLPTGPAPTLTAALPGATTAGPKPGINLPPESSYGLFAPNRTLLPGTMLAKEEAVKTAVNRLAPYLQTLLALKLVRLTENRASSQLAVAAVLETVQPQLRPLEVQTTERRLPEAWPLAIRQAQKSLATAGPLLLPRDSRIGYRIANTTAQALHLLWINFNSRGECTALVNLSEVNPEEDTDQIPAPRLLEAGQLLPQPRDGAGWAMPGSATWVEAYLILSTQPLDRCLAVLSGEPPSLDAGFRPVPKPLKLAQALLQDLSLDPNTEGKSAVQDAYALHHDRWTTLSFRYDIA